MRLYRLYGYYPNSGPSNGTKHGNVRWKLGSYEGIYLNLPQNSMEPHTAVFAEPHSGFHLKLGRCLAYRARLEAPCKLRGESYAWPSDQHLSCHKTMLESHQESCAYRMGLFISGGKQHMNIRTWMVVARLLHTPYLRVYLLNNHVLVQNLRYNY